MSPTRIMRVEIASPDEFLGDLLAELNTRHGRVSGLEPVADGSIILAELPYRELRIYNKRLQAITRGRAFYSTAFSHYEPGDDDEPGDQGPDAPSGIPSRPRPPGPLAATSHAEPPPEKSPDSN